MLTFACSSLILLLQTYSFVDITELSADDEFPESLHFDALDEFETVDYEEIESIDLDNLPDSTTNRHSVDDLCGDRKSTRLNSSHIEESRMPSSA